MRFSDRQLEKFYLEFQECKNSIDARFDKVIETQERMIKDTADIIQLHKDLQSTARLGIKIQKFGLWLVRWPVIGIGLYAIYKWVTTRLIV